MKNGIPSIVFWDICSHKWDMGKNAKYVTPGHRGVARRGRNRMQNSDKGMGTTECLPHLPLSPGAVPPGGALGAADLPASRLGKAGPENPVSSTPKPGAAKAGRPNASRSPCREYLRGTQRGRKRAWPGRGSAQSPPERRSVTGFGCSDREKPAASRRSVFNFFPRLYSFAPLR